MKNNQGKKQKIKGEPVPKPDNYVGKEPVPKPDKRSETRVAEGIEEILKLIAPGTPIRNGLENILNAKTGALIAIADNEEVLKLVDRGI